MHSTSSRAITLALFSLLSTTSAYAAENHAHTKHSQSPAGLMNEHNMKAGTFMTSYSYESMNMQGYRNGDKNLSSQQVLAQGYTMAAKDMDMQMHMFGIMGGITDDITAMAMIPYIEKSMTHLDSHGATSKMKNEGMGDIKLSASTNVFERTDLQAGHRIGSNLSLGASLPTGSINKDFTHTHNDGERETHHMEYGMQLGSGTVDPILGATLYDHFGRYSLGLRGEYTARTYDNENHYHLGDEARVNAWAQTELTDFMSASLRLDAKKWGNVEGRDSKVSTTMMPGGKTSQTGGERIDGLVGISLYHQTGTRVAHDLSIEFGVPLYEELDGPQMKTENILTLRYSFSF